MMNGVDHL